MDSKIFFLASIHPSSLDRLMLISTTKRQNDKSIKIGLFFLQKIPNPKSAFRFSFIFNRMNSCIHNSVVVTWRTNCNFYNSHAVLHFCGRQHLFSDFFAFVVLLFGFFFSTGTYASNQFRRLVTEAIDCSIVDYSKSTVDRACHADRNTKKSVIFVSIIENRQFLFLCVGNYSDYSHNLASFLI